MLQNVTPVDSGAVSCYHDRHNWPLRGMGQLIFLDCPEFRGDIRSSESSLDALYTGREDSNWVQTEGYVAAVDRTTGVLLLTVVEGVHKYEAYLTGAGALTDHLLDARVRLEGVCGTLYNERRQLIGIKLYVPGARYVTIPQARSRQHGGHPRNAHLQPVAILPRGTASRSCSGHTDPGRSQRRCIPRRLHGGAPGPGDSARGPSPWRRSGSRRPAGSRPVFRDPEERRGPEAGTGCAAQPAGRFSGGRSHRRVRCPTGAHGGQ